MPQVSRFSPGAGPRYRGVVRLLPLAVLVVVLAGCGGSGTDVPEPLATTVVPGLESRDRDLAADVLTADAFEPAPLAELLDDGGYAGGRERELTGHTPSFDHVIARTLRFDDPAGADAYLDWVRAHTLDLVGRTRPLDPYPVGDRFLLFELLPCSTCKKQLPTLVAVWRRGGAVGYVLASGRDADRASVRRLVDAADLSVTS
jgi:hypothetical protein